MRAFRLFMTATLLLRRHAGSIHTPSSPLVSVLSLEALRLHRAYGESTRQEVIRRLQELAPNSPPERTRQDVDNFYIPLYCHVSDLLRRHREADTRPAGPLTVGISAPQGCGKTTMTGLLEHMFKLDNKRCISFSLDDFYLTGAAQERLAALHSADALLQYRGNAGTHDLDLLFATMKQLRHLHTDRRQVLIPMYDKSLRAGRGDRAPQSQWRIIDADKPVDIVLLEGWMLGFEPLSDEDVSATSHGAQVAKINQYLKSYGQLHDLFDAWLIIAVENTDCVYKWRQEGEMNMGLQGKPRLSDAQIKDFVNRFMPAYHAYLPKLYRQGPRLRSPDVPVLKILVDERRIPVSCMILADQGPEV